MKFMLSRQVRHERFASESSVVSVEPGNTITVFDSAKDMTSIREVIVAIIERDLKVQVSLDSISDSELIEELTCEDGIIIGERCIDGKPVIIKAIEVSLVTSRTETSTDEVLIQDAGRTIETVTPEEADFIINLPEVKVMQRIPGKTQITERTEVIIRENGQSIGFNEKVIQDGSPEVIVVAPASSIKAEAVSATNTGQPKFTKLKNSVSSRPFTPKVNFEDDEKLDATAEDAYKITDEERASIPKAATITVVVGPSGSGKTTLVRDVANSHNTLISFTTRPARPGEIHGRDYYFITDEEAEQLKANKQLLEYVEYNGHKYGYTNDEVLGKLKSKGWVICVATLDGFKHLKHVFGDVVRGLYLDISEETVKSQLAGRNDSPENIAKRLELYQEEVANKTFFEEREDSLIVKVSNDFKENLDRFETALVTLA